MADDFSELRDLEVDFTAAPEKALRNVDKAIKYTSMEMRTDWQQGAEASGLDAYSKSIDFTMSYPGDAIESEIGPNLGKRQGMFGFVEEAGGGVRSAPQQAGRDALEANEDDLERGLMTALLDSLDES